MKKLLQRLFGATHDRLRLPEMMNLRGARLPAHMGDAAARDAGLAARRCEYCNSKQLCDAYLQAGNPDAYRGFCPNAPYIETRREKTPLT